MNPKYPQALLYATIIVGMDGLDTDGTDNIEAIDEIDYIQKLTRILFTNAYGGYDKFIEDRYEIALERAIDLDFVPQILRQRIEQSQNI